MPNEWPAATYLPQVASATLEEPDPTIHALKLQQVKRLSLFLRLHLTRTTDSSASAARRSHGLRRQVSSPERARTLYSSLTSLTSVSSLGSDMDCPNQGLTYR